MRGGRRDRAGAAGVTGAPGVVAGSDAASVLEEVQQLMAGHRVWDRFPARLG